jgi:hypothetical protein
VPEVTTLVNLIPALRPSAGEAILVDGGYAAAAGGAHAARHACMFQINQLFRGLTVLENVYSRSPSACASLPGWGPAGAEREASTGGAAQPEALRLADDALKLVRESPHGASVGRDAIALAQHPRGVPAPRARCRVPSSEAISSRRHRRADPDIAILIIEHDMEVVFRRVARIRCGRRRGAHWKAARTISAPTRACAPSISARSSRMARWRRSSMASRLVTARPWSGRYRSTSPGRDDLDHRAQRGRQDHAARDRARHTTLHGGDVRRTGATIARLAPHRRNWAALATCQEREISS